MKKILFSILALVAIATTARAQVEINSTNFPDEIFRNIVSVNYDTDSDGFLSDEEIAAVKLTSYGTGYPLMNKGITSLKGIEYFTALITLSCHQNQLTELDISKNTELTGLECYRNQIKGAEMDALIESLKTLAENGRTGTVWIFEKSNSNEGNVVTWYQIDALSDFGRISNPWTANFIDWTNATSGPYEGSDIEINAENFPDAAFRNIVSVNYDTDSDGFLSKAEATAVTMMNVADRGIADLTGIKYFTALEFLNCRQNQLQSLDVSGCTALKNLECPYNQLTSLEVSGCTALEFLDCNFNYTQLQSLDVSGCAALKGLFCAYNRLTSLDVSGCTALQTLYCEYNKMQSLNVSGCTALTSLACAHNELTSLDVSGCTALYTLSCEYNKLQSLDVSGCTALTRIDCYRNQIKGDKMQALVNSLPTESSGRFYVIDTKDSEGNVITKSQVAIAKGKNWKVYDYNGGSMVEYAGSDDTPTGSDIEINAENFPDAAFRNFVSTNYDTDSSGTLSKAEATAVTEMDVRHKNIANLKGIEFFTALESLDCSHNLLTSLDVSKNTALKTLSCVNNQLTSLDVSKNTALIQLFCYINQLTSLDVSKNTALTTLSCYDNQLTSLNVSGCTALEDLTCRHNLLTSLDVSKNTALTTLSCYNNQLTSLNVSGCTALYVLRCHDNQLTSLDVSGCTALERLFCENNQLTSLYVSKSTTLWWLSCYGNQIKGDKMQALVESLSTRLNTGLFDVIDTKNKNEKNVITKSQVAIAKGKKWRVRDWSGDSVVEYEGSDDPIQQATWTVVQIDNAVKTEMVVVRNGANDTVNCTAPFTTQTIDPENLTKVTLRVATTGGASEYGVYLVNYGSRKTAVIKVVIELTGLGLMEAKALVESADGTTPVLIATFPTAAEAQAAKEALETEGATVQVIGNGSTTTRIFRDGVDVTAQGTADGNYLCFEVSPDNLANTTWVITAEPVMPEPGDVNGDGSVNMQDVKMVLNKSLD